MKSAIANPVVVDEYLAKEVCLQSRGTNVEAYQFGVIRHQPGEMKAYR